MEIGTYPERKIAASFFGDEFQYTRMRLLRCRAIDELKQHGIGNMKGSELVERRGRQKDLSSVVGGVSLGTGQHGDGVAAVVFVEPSRSTGAR